MSARSFTRRCGAYLALAALGLQLVLSFAHLHKHDLAVPRIDRTDIVGVTHARSGLHFAERLPPRLADDDDNCPICFSGFLLSTSSLPDAPSSLYPLQFAEIDCAFHPVSDRIIRPRHAAFRSRAPPTV
ncbi:hypothetical protein JQ616_06400 [Bradyrhizobium tropiciagri]|jgi:hypothetical protein|uniref:hypothetical protein n=1 Tax=Bradyrhizobium TaxID=374 RepID=UPI0012FD62E7|nr:MULTISPECIES: hypothetical protein [Bradyrhizobium]MBR0894576.1 hypothetical protein [Bradyrhizobium tropiciagri]